jgi:hypothetical protein
MKEILQTSGYTKGGIMCQGGVIWKTNTIPILMHQMRIGTQAEKVGNAGKKM